MIITGTRHRLLKRIYEYFLHSATKESFTYFSQFKDIIISDLDEARHILEIALSKVKLDGLHCEFGVFQGQTLNIASDIKKDVTWHGFDSFEGLQEDWKGGYYHKGHFNLNGNIPIGLNSNIVIHKGWFKDTLPKFVFDEIKPIAFANIDCDTYESTKEVLNILGQRITKGTILILDDYHSYYGWKQGQHKAWKEFVSDHLLKYKYIGIGVMSAIIEVL